jgi:serine/tyrosine/threonine adenylyltransferase
MSSHPTEFQGSVIEALREAIESGIPDARASPRSSAATRCCRHEPYAACYGGHQFGHWAGQLGDGRAITLGEVVNAAAASAGSCSSRAPAPRPTRARRRPRRAALVAARVPLQRGHAPPRRADHARAEPGGHRRAGGARHVLRRHPRPEPGAVVCRVAPSFIRFGNFELPPRAARSSCCAQLADFTIAATSRTRLDASLRPPTRALVREVCERTARWSRTGCGSASCTA